MGKLPKKVLKKFLDYLYVLEETAGNTCSLKRFGYGVDVQRAIEHFQKEVN